MIKISRCEPSRKKNSNTASIYLYSIEIWFVCVAKTYEIQIFGSERGKNFLLDTFSVEKTTFL